MYSSLEGYQHLQDDASSLNGPRYLGTGRALPGKGAAATGPDRR